MLALLPFWAVLEASAFLFLPASYMKGKTAQLFFVNSQRGNTSGVI